MPCSNPRPALLRTCVFTGESKLWFPKALSFRYSEGYELTGSDFLIPCGQCLYCRIKQSSDWATRCMHEASLYDANSFVTLTFDNSSLKKMCPDGGLQKKHMVDFMKNLRRSDALERERLGLHPRNIRAFYCGEYGGRTNRPHYHALLFNCDFPDMQLYKKDGSTSYYNSDFLQSVWKHGFAVIGSIEFASAAYVARYCTKKVTGKKSLEHYGGRQPEFAQGSLKPGLWVVS